MPAEVRDGGGWHVLGLEAVPRSSGRRDSPESPQVGFNYVHAVNRRSPPPRLCRDPPVYEIHPYGRGAIRAGFTLSAAAFFTEHGISIRGVMTDNAKNCVIFDDFLGPLTTLGVRHLGIKAHCPWRYGKVEQFNRTLQAEWAYRQPFTTNPQRADALET